ncbi:F0F1 ATP synthase subunit alpha [Carnobacteriaceae bacterium 52-44]|jgi:F-type H+-transporting ATPase subunit alpha
MDRKSEQIIQKLQERIQQVDWEFSDLDTGVVLTVGDGISFVRGLRNVQANELVRFENGTFGLALNLEENQVGVILLGEDRGIREGDTVYRTEEIVQVPVGDNLLGRIIDPLGEPLDNKGPIETTEERNIERVAPGVMTRHSVDRPLFTGLKVIDSMIPIGKGQRELIIGDRQTGKTSIALNTILNQKGQNVKCVYVAIGQKSSTVVQVAETLERYGAMDYTVIVNSPADDSAARQYISPYAGCAIGEYWMDNGEDVLIIYDDLSKHAVSYRTISLLLKRPSGREAYPGDVFYLHSRLLERAGQLNDNYGGGSMTALPIIETQLGDISAYIPTNVISITDGQLFLDTEQFNSGQRPAVDSGLSVSRVGSSAQTDAMRSVSGSLKLELATYEELSSFAQFSSDIDPETQKTIDHGDRLMELLKQPAYQVIPHELIVLSLYLSEHNWINELEVEQVRPFERYMQEAFTNNHGDLLEELAENYELTEDLQHRIDEVLKNLLEEFKVMQNG